jgi:hypothetical protein
MKPWERWSFNVASLVVAVTGFAYFWMKYAVQTDDPFAVVNHPWQNAMLTLHLLASPPIILLFGIILNSHIMKKLRVPRMPNRRSGLLSLATFIAMVCSGYLLQVTMNEEWMTALVAVHVTSGALFAGAYGIHLLISLRLVRRGSSVEAVREVA